MFNSQSAKLLSFNNWKFVILIVMVTNDQVSYGHEDIDNQDSSLMSHAFQLRLIWIAGVLLMELVVMFEGTANTKLSKRNIANIMAKVEDKCNGDEECLSATYKKLEESISQYFGEYLNV